jgi:hypothetical protein
MRRCGSVYLYENLHIYTQEHTFLSTYTYIYIPVITDFRVIGVIYIYIYKYTYENLHIYTQEHTFLSTFTYI